MANAGSFQAALAHHRAGRVREAEGLYRDIVGRDPRHADALHMLALLAAEAGDYAGAIGWMKRVIAVLPGHAMLQAEMGEMYRRAGDLAAAAASCRRAVALDPRLAAGHYNLGVVLQAQGDFAAAVESYQAALLIDGAYPGAHYNLGNALRRLGQSQEAMAAYQRALAIRPDHLEARGNLGLVLQEKGELDGALACFMRVAEARPGDAVAHQSVGNVLRAKGDREGAAAAYRRALAIDPGDAAANTNYGKLLHDGGKPADAVAFYRAAIAAAPRRGEAYQNLGMALEQLGQRSEAAAAYTAALELGAGTPEARYHMAAYTGTHAPPQAPASHVREAFDQFAQTFDEHLGRLHYRGPELLHGAVADFFKARGRAFHVGHLMDLGCGTGLCAPLFRGNCDRLTGIDLAPRMLEKARERGLYDELIAGDIAAVLGEKAACCELALAADVLVYMGDLRAFFEAVRGALVAGGVLAYSAEVFEGGDFRLLPSRRYAHSAEYLRRVAGESGLTEVSLSTAVLRREAAAEVKAFVVVLEARAPSVGWRLHGSCKTTEPGGGVESRT